MAKVLTGNSKRYQHVLSFSKSTGLFRQELLPTAVELLWPRKSHAVFKIFCDTFVSCTYGKKEYQKLCTSKTLSKFITVSDEAYTVAYLQNCYEVWMDQANDPTGAKKVEWRKKKWTSEAHTASKYKGWNDEGLTFYNDLQQTITQERTTGEAKILEVAYREDSWQANEASKKRGGGGKKKTETTAVKMFVDFTELDSDEEIEGGDLYSASAGNTKDSALDLNESADDEENSDEEEDNDEEENNGYN